MYEVPPFLISEPESYGQGLYKVKTIDIGPEMPLSFKLRCASLPDSAVEATTHWPIERVKAVYLETHKLQDSALKLFYNGKEMKDGYMLGNFGVGEGCVVQVFGVIRAPTT